MKKILNDVHGAVNDMLHGFNFEYKAIIGYDRENDIIYRKNLSELEEVVLISGGGSGHEPAHFGYVGEGMLSMAVCGQIFMPPKPEQIAAAIRMVDKGKSILLIIKNFQADIDSFLAAEAVMKQEGWMVDHVIVNDDVSVEDDHSFKKRRRGVAGTVLVHKILGAAAMDGYTLPQLKALGEVVISKLHTLGVALSPANNPASQEEPFMLGDDEVFYGIGIHGEGGYRKEVFHSSEMLAIELMNKLKSLYRWKKGEAFAVLVNGLGAVPLMEQYVFANDIRRLCELEGLDIRFVKVGSQLTSLDMKGISLSLLKIEDPMWEKWLQRDVKTASWK
ncbi:DhaKLM operon coactivator DhaQ [Pradoshia sp.]